MSSQTTELIQAMPAAFLPDRAGDAKALIQLDLTGNDGGPWLLDIGDGKCEVRAERTSEADVTVTMSAEDFAALYSNQLNAVQAFMGGRIKVAGNVGLVMQLLNWFDR